MQPVAEELRSRQIQFLAQCLDVIEDDLCEGNEALVAFYRQCLTHLRTNEQLLSSDLLSCDVTTSEEQKAHPKTYRKRMDKLVDAFEHNSTRLRPLLREHELTRMPVLKYVKRSGAGNESYYQVTVDDGRIGEKGVEPSAQQTSPTVESTNSPPPTNQLGCIQYRTRKISRAPWYLRLADPLFRTQSKRMRFAAILLFMFFLFLPGVIVYLYRLQQPTIVTLLLFAVVLALYLYLYAPMTNLLRLLSRKIVLLDAIRLPVSSVCISEVTKVPDDGSNPMGVERALSVISVSADCPICLELYGLRESVLLEQKGLLNSWIYGACSNNPMMHRYSFDKDLMTGQPFVAAATRQFTI